MTTASQELPPYGLMWSDFEDAARANVRPGHWAAATAGVDDWPAWVEETVGLIATHLWPERRDTGWAGAAESGMEALTRTELDLILRFGERHFRQQAWPGAFGAFSHRDLFDAEDQGGWGVSLARYCPVLAPWTSRIEDVIGHALDNKASALDLALKRRFQRPRAYQVAMVLEGGWRGRFRHRAARSAFTPALISGHAYQGLVGGIATLCALEREDAALAGRLRPAVERWSTDIGDRRVMAGVHYPTDSLASWIVVLRLAPRVFREADIAARVKKAIGGSLLYAFLREVIEERGEAPALQPAWALLQQHLA